MHKEILTSEQVKLLPSLKKFSNDFFLVGGTAFAFYMGHRQSIDFDLFSFKEFKNLNIKRRILRMAKIEKIYANKLGEFTILIKGVKITFFQYPFKIKAQNKLNDIIRMPDLLTLTAMKAYSLGHRAKWKDYVDLFFVMKNYYGIDKIIKKAEQIFGQEFNEKIFRTQLVYFKDIDYSEKIIYMKKREVSDKTIQKELIDFSLTGV